MGSVTNKHEAIFNNSLERSAQRDASRYDRKYRPGREIRLDETIKKCLRRGLVGVYSCCQLPPRAGRDQHPAFVVSPTNCPISAISSGVGEVAI